MRFDRLGSRTCRAGGFLPVNSQQTFHKGHPMRALCGAIIMAGALIGLGLTAVAYGMRFQTFGPGVLNPDSHHLYGMPTLLLILVVLLISMLIGVGIAFIGLAYHHERRFHEQQQALSTANTRTSL
jgi:hypothetical protein